MEATQREAIDALRSTLKEREQLRGELQRLRAGASEPIAIVGMACRYPGGVSSPAQLWQLVAAGGDGISEFPADRDWDLEHLFHPDPDNPGTSYSHEGGFIAGAGDFDSEFFGIGPREALAMDPQQRLLLESCWEALEDAGIDPGSLAGSQTGVFAGVMHHDYGWLQGPIPAALEDKLAAGGTSSIVSGRVAYALGLEGPAMTVDTACSSSLVALHLASQALRSGECSLALAGGVTVLAKPEIFVQFSRMRGLAPDGRCKSFAGSADGTGFAEGVGVLALERLSDAERNGHPVLALVRGSAVNQDGASNGLTAPNGPSQERVIRQALASAGLEAEDIDAVEGHGTGTTLGDPIEAGALLATYGAERGENGPLRLGSLKSNIGHTQAAAGVGGVIKMVEALRHGALPKTLHVDAPSNHVDWSAGAVELLTEAKSWDAGERTRRAGISSFGATGTNSHLILEEAPAPQPAEGEAAPGSPLTGLVPLPLSAKTEPALREAAARLATQLRENPELDPADAGFSLATTRALFERRAVVVGADREQLLAGLDALGQGEAAASAISARARAGKLAYLFTGQGSQRLGMGAELYSAYPAYAEAFDRVCEAIDPELGTSLKELVLSTDPAQAERLDHTTYAQPALFAIEVALFELLGSFGMAPDLLAGHSIGELTAAHVAGVLSLEDAAKLVVARGRLMGELPEGGAMVALEGSEAEVAEALQGQEAELSLAAINSPTSIVVSGTEAAIDAIEAAWREKDRKTKRLAVSHAFHSALMEPMLAEFEQLARSLTYNEPKIPIVSNLSGELLDPADATDPAYWVRHVREPVRFADGVAALAKQGATTFVELGPDAVLSALGPQCLPDDAQASFIPTLREGREEPAAIVGALASVHAHGAKVEWSSLYPGAKRVGLPTYPFQRERFWLSSGLAGADPTATGQTPADHPLLGAEIELPGDQGWLFTGRLSLQSHPWLADHAVAGTVLLPGTAFVELALHAGQRAGADAIEELTLQAPLILSEAGAVSLRVSVGQADEQGSRPVTIHSHGEGGDGQNGAGEWTLHAAGSLGAGQPGAAAPLDGAWPPQGAEPIDPAYTRLAELGFDYGAAFQGLSRAWAIGEEIYAEVALGAEQREQAEHFGIHPALLDSALHAGILAALDGEAESQLHLPFAWSGINLSATGATELRVRISRPGEGEMAIAVFDPSGAPVASVASLLARPVDPAQLQARAGAERSLFAVEWTPLALQSPNGSAPSLAVLGDLALAAVEAERYADLAALLVAIDGGATAPDVVLCGPGPMAEEVPAAAQAETLRLLSLLQGAIATESLAATKLVYLAERALTVANDESADLRLAPAMGLLRSASSEHPGRFGAVDHDGTEASLAALPAALLSAEPQLALREGAALVPRLANRPAAHESAAEAPCFDPGRTVLITGAMGGIGALVARHLVELHGARQLLLVSRRGAEAAGAAELQSELEDLGAEVEIAACDVAEREQLAELLAGVPAEHPLGAVIHSAGILDDGVIEALDPERIERVFAPKVDAAWHLHELTKDLDLSHFVLFSSVAGLLGGAAQGNYAAANAFLDGLAAQRQAQGLAGTSLAWGLWGQDSGMQQAEMSADELARAGQQIRERLGLVPLTPQRGLELFDAAMALPDALLVPAQIDTSSLRRMAEGGVLAPLLSGLVRVPARRAATGSLAAKLAAVAEPERQAVVLDLVRSQVAAVLGHSSAEAVDAEKPFKDLGFDSLAAVELRNRLAAATGMTLPATLVFDYPSSQGLAEHLLGAVTGGAEARRAVVRAQASEEPIAIVGMACRYPGGVGSPQDLWTLLAEGRDGIVEFPVDRGWDLENFFNPDPDNSGTSYAREGGFLGDAGDFDAEFFGISPREALAMDPQQRLLLESCWEALEDAGVDPGSLAGSATGVFAGVMYHDYGIGGGAPPAELEGYFASGVAGSVASGRVAYTLGLEGPAMTVDTACSSSLVTLHLASQALHSGECSLALAGGATVLATPFLFTEFSRQRGLAPDGRSKPFAEAADGVGWSEGVGMLALERLSDAERNGHQILALVKGSAVNQDGASNGLTAPNGPSQQRVIRQALANARLEAKDIDVVEAHGTGTTLGDPIEAGALLATYGQDRPAGRPLYVGAVKSNLGHTQAAAGVAGVIKAVLAMREGVMPKTLHLDRPSSHVDWSAGELELLGEARPWQAGERTRRVAVSSFGISGTNAHVILEEAPVSTPAPLDGEGGEDAAAVPLSGPLPLLLSAKTKPALAAQAARLAARLEADPELSPLDLAYSLATSRGVFSERAVALGSERAELQSALTALANGKEADNLAQDSARTSQDPVFLFPGQGSQSVGMALGLYEGSAFFKAQIDACEQALAPFVDWSLVEVLREEQGAWLDRLDIVQPALFAVMVSLAKLWQACGVTPAAVIGHSQGEIAAAHIAGGLSLEDAARIVASRAQAMAKIAGQGGMLSVSLSEAELAARLAPYGERLSIAAINGPASLVVSGEPAALGELQQGCEAEEIRTQTVAVDYAAHSAQIDALEAELLEAFAPIAPRSGAIPFHSTVTGELLDTAELDASYWCRNLRQTVLFEPALRAQLKQGSRAFVEIGPHPVLGFGAAETAEAAGAADAALLQTLRRDEDGAERFMLSLAEAHAAGARVDWEVFFKGTAAKLVPLPTYPFQRRRFWLESGAAPADATAIGQDPTDHPLLSSAVELEQGGLLLTGAISLTSHPWLADHALAGTVLFPGTAFLELALCAAGHCGATQVKELTLEAPLVLGKASTALRVSVGEADQNGERQISIHARPAQGVGGEPAAWSRHAGGTLCEEQTPLPAPLSAWPPAGAEQLDLADFYPRLADVGVEFGPAFQGLTAAWRDGEEIYAEISLAPEQRQEASGYELHPALADAALHCAHLDALAQEGAAPRLAMPFCWREVSLRGGNASEARVVLRGGAEEISLRLTDSDGAPLAEVGSLLSRAVSPAQLGGASGTEPESLFDLRWEEIAALESTAVGDLPTIEDLAGLHALLDGGDPAPEVVLRLRSSGSPAPDSLVDALHTRTNEVLELIQDWLAEERFAASRLAILSNGAVKVDPDEDLVDLPAAAIWGLIRSVQLEYPGRIVLVDSDDTPASAAALAALFEGEEPQLALREGLALAPRVVPAVVSGSEEPIAIDPDSTVLITGGTGGLGALFATHLVEAHGARQLLLVSRSGPDAKGAEQLADKLAELGAEARIVACDVSDREQLSALLAELPAEHPLGAVIHAAGVISGERIGKLTATQVDEVYAAKADAAWHLHELTAGLDLSAFLMFSSVSGSFGGFGLANYAAANAFLDALAQLRRAQGLAAVSMVWGLWAGTGGLTAGLSEEDIARMARSGAGALSDADGLRLFDRALAVNLPLPFLTQFNSVDLRARARGGTLPAVLRGMVRVPQRRRSEGADSLAARLAIVPGSEQGKIVLDLILAEVAAVLGHESGAAISAQNAFQEIGFASITAVELRNRLVAITGLQLPPTLVFDYPTPAALAEHLRELATESGGASAPVSVAAQSSDEAVAIVGMACRYPGGVNSPEQLWELLADGRDGISGFPADRGWDLSALHNPDADPDRLGTSLASQGGFMSGAADFDAEFFGVSPREALATDPQQRLLLESCWEALEDAGVAPDSLRGSDTAVFAGALRTDYSELPSLEGYRAVGLSSSVISGRVSYTLGLEGPAMTVDTACSSSLVALHLAAASLRNGECSLALAGGVTVLGTPGVFVEFSRQRGLSPDGRCKSFADAADGTGFAEGVGMLVLERLSDAERNGHAVLATIRGSAVNQDGASNGLTAPNGPSQQRVIRQALANARLGAADIDAVEAHGTGTTLGDPIEAGALLATYGQERPEGQPLRLGSIKSNIGHAQAAAGVAGVIKTVLAMRAGVLPKTLHVDRPSANVDWSAGEIELLDEPHPWAPGERIRRAAVSAFGISGTNAHLILEEAPASPLAQAGEAESGDGAGNVVLPGPLPLLLSAKTKPALAVQAARIAGRLKADPELSPLDLAHSLATTRSAFSERTVVLGSEREELLATLSVLGEGKRSPATVSATASSGRLAYLFTGQGSQRAGMGAQLYAAYPAFATAFNRVCEAIDPELGESLAELVLSTDPAQAERLDHTTYAQPALFAIEVALFELLRSFGMAPDLLAGHSIGEITAAHVAGVLSLEDAAKLVVARGRLMGELPEGGAMVALEGSEAEVSEALEGKEAELSLAAINSPSSIVVSGTEAAIDAIEAAWREKERKTKRLAVSHAFHSALMEPMLAEFEQLASSLSYREPKIPIVSNLSGELLDPADATDPAYWVRHVREPVRFADGVTTLAKQGASTFVELGPDAVLSALGPQCLADDSTASFIPTLREGREEPAAIVGALASAHVHGASVDWESFFAPAKPQRVPLPTYPFQRQRFWPVGSRGTGDLSAAGLAPADHPLLEVVMTAPEGQGLALSGAISLATHPWLADHAIAGAVLLPGTAFLDLALCAAGHCGASQVKELTLEAPLIMGESESIALRVSVGEPDEDGERAISIHSRSSQASEDGEPAEWSRHASGALSDEQATSAEPLSAWPPAGVEQLDLTDFYPRLADLGFEYGPAFQGLTKAWSDGEEIYAEVSLAPEQSEEAAGYGLHPALTDAALHGALAALLNAEGDAPVSLRLPFSWRGVSLQGEGGAAFARVALGVSGETISLRLADSEGNPLAAVGSLAAREISPAALSPSQGAGKGLFTVVWRQSSGATGEGTDASESPAPELQIRELIPDASLSTSEAARGAAAEALALIQQWLGDEERASSRLAICTKGAVAVNDEESPDPAAAAIWGLVRSAQTEHPGRFVLVDSDGSEASQAALSGALVSDEPQLALREGKLLVARAERIAPAEHSGEEPLAAIDPERTVLITGATGGLGALFARHLVETHDARHLLLVSRSGPEAKGAAELQTELEELGAEVRIAACDVSERNQLKALLAGIDSAHPLGAVVHAAGTLDDATIDSMSAEQLASVFPAKADAALALHELSAELDLSAFVLFSSVAGTLGGPGQGNYAAANCFLDALAQSRRVEGLPATSIAWGLWERESGMTAGLSEADMARLARSGLMPISDERGVEFFDAALDSERGQLLAAPIDSSRLRSLAGAGVLPPLLSSMVRIPAKRAGAEDAQFVSQLRAAADESAREALVTDLVLAHVADVLGYQSPQAIGLNQAFAELGFDSLAAVELRNHLTAATGLSLPATVIFDYPTCAALVSYLLETIGDDGGETANVELGQLEAALVAIPEDHPGRSALADRLRTLVATFEGGSEAPPQSDVAASLETASDDELLRFIDEQLPAGAEPDATPSDH